MNETFRIRRATVEDCGLVLDFVMSLATYENRQNEVVATEEILRKSIFENHEASVIFAVEDEIEVGFAVYCHNFSTFLGRKQMYLEDLFVKPEYRGKGYGKALLKELAKIAKEENCERLDWTCLNWNTHSIDFYLSNGAKPLNQWTLYRLTGDELTDFAQGAFCIE